MSGGQSPFAIICKSARKLVYPESMGSGSQGISIFTAASWSRYISFVSEPQILAPHQLRVLKSLSGKMSFPLSSVVPQDQIHALKQTTSKQSIQANEYMHEGPETTSIFSELNRKQTARKYWKVCLEGRESCNSADDRQAIIFCMISGLAACMDGFQTKIPGSIIANRGFINQFGEFRSTL